jgi:hypothetical protein
MGTRCPSNHAESVFRSPAISGTVRVGRRTSPGNLLDLGFHYRFDEELPHSSQQIAQTGLCQFSNFSDGKSQLGVGLVSAHFRKFSAARLPLIWYCLFTSDSFFLAENFPEPITALG